MEIQELKSYSEVYLRDMDILMHQLSISSNCTEERLRAVVEDGKSHLYVIRKDGSIVATATLCVNHTPEFTLGCVEAVVVDSDCRGMGLARQLMEHIFEEAKHFGCVKVHLTCNPRRVAANALYQKIGFHLYATNYYEKEL